MDNIFKRTSAHWVRYDKYEWKKNRLTAFCTLLRQRCRDVTYNPIKEYEELVLTALGVGLDVVREKSFYGRTKTRGFRSLPNISALPTTSEFITYDAVYLPKNHFIKQETLSTEDYLAYFFPFDKISFVKKVRNLCGIQITGKCLR